GVDAGVGRHPEASGPAADLVAGLQDGDRDARVGQPPGRGESGQPGPDDDHPHDAAVPDRRLASAPGVGANTKSSKVSSTSVARATRLSTRVANSESPPSSKKSLSAVMSSSS